MWLLSTDRAELHHFPSPEAVTGGYAILSHTWDGNGEQTYEELRDIQRRYAPPLQIPQDGPPGRLKGSASSLWARV